MYVCTYTHHSHVQPCCLCAKTLKTLPSGKVTVFLCQIASRTSSRKYLSATDEVCVSIPPLTISLKRFFLS